MRNMIWLVIVLLAIAAAGVGLAVKLSTHTHSVEALKYEKEWVVALLQAGLIGVLGAVTAAVLELFKDGLQRSKDRSKLQFDAYTELRQLYHEVKLIRRNFQAFGTLGEEDVTKLNRIQLALEGLRDDSDLFPRVSAIFDALSSMEKYLNKVANKPRSKERKLFSSSDSDRKTFKVFSMAYSSASKAMRTEIAPTSIWARWRAAIASKGGRQEGSRLESDKTDVKAVQVRCLAHPPN